MSKNRKLNILFALLQLFYWMSACALLCFAVIFLKERGFTNSITGVVLSLGDIAGLLLVTSNADVTDKQKTGFSFLAAIAGAMIQAALFLILFAVQRSRGVIAVSFVICVALGQLVNSMNVKMLVDFMHAGQSIDFGKARSFGSISYGVTALLIGLVVNAGGVSVIPALGLFAVSAEIVTVILLRRNFDMPRDSRPDEKVETKPVSSLGTVSFLRSNKKFLVLLSGLALIFAMNNSVGSYLILIVENVGGGVSDLGKLTCFFALLECPMMLFYGKLRKRYSCILLLRTSLLFFFVKIAILSVSQSIPVIYLSFSTQILSMGLYTPVIVDYISETFSYADSAKAQSLAMMMATVGTVVSSFLTGVLLDHIPIGRVVFFYSLLSLAGVIISVIGTDKKPVSRT